MPPLSPAHPGRLVLVPAVLGATVTAFPKPSRRERLKNERVATYARILRLADIRREVILRAGGRCEFCRGPVPPGEMHHILGGARRRRRERLDTLAFVCLRCHQGYHRGDAYTLACAKDWARAHRFGESLEAIERRVDKSVEAARMVWRAPQ